MSRKILTLPEVAARTRLPLSTIRWMRQRGAGPPTWKLGRRVVAYEDELEAWLAQQHKATSTAYQQAADPGRGLRST